MIMVKSNLGSVKVEELDTDCEIVWAKLTTKTKRTLFICSYYRPNAKDTTSILQFQTSIERALNSKNAFVLAGGDFNFPGWDYTTMTLKPNTPNSETHHKLIEILQDNGLEQMVTEPTREKNTLDLIISNTPQLIPRVETMPRISDHKVVYAELNIDIALKHQAPRTITLYKTADWNQLKEAAKQTSEAVISNTATDNTEDLWQFFKKSILDAVNKFIRHKAARLKDREPWVTPQLRRLANRRDRAYKRWKKNGLEDCQREARALRAETQREQRRAYWAYLDSTLTEEEPEERSNNKRFFTHLKHQRTSNSGIAPLKVNGQLITEPQAKAETLNSQFNSAFSDGATYSRTEYDAKCGKMTGNFPTLDTLEINEAGVCKLLKQLKPEKAGGPDGIASRVLKELCDEIAPGLTAIFRSSISSGEVPLDWKDAIVTPIFKKGEHYKPSNYRPVSLTCIACKTMEHIIVHTAMKHLENNNILCPQQHGFRKERSCETQLLELVEELTTSVAAGVQTDIVIMDFAKAFDKVNHSLLLHKLFDYGIQGDIHRWIQSFLTGRRQAVVVEGVQSDFISVRSGVPQGSVLGPCLFLVYINDLPEKLSSKTRMFADDTTVYASITSTDDSARLQRDLVLLENWEEKWDMVFHPDKCALLPVTRKTSPIPTSYQLHGHTLATVQSAKYLGVTIQANMEWEEHVNNITQKAGQALGFLRRNLKISSTKLREKAYLVYVRPLLEYASSVWDPYLKCHADKIESIQRRAARFVMNRYHRTASVTAMLTNLGWISRNDMVKVNKSKLEPLPERARRSHNQQFRRITNPRGPKYRQFSFLPRAIREWNDLPQEVIDASSAASFRHGVARHLRVATLDGLAVGLQSQ
jgi:outer membrane lipopolysaccharide assembly protein LptE/RlpB